MRSARFAYDLSLLPLLGTGAKVRGGASGAEGVVGALFSNAIDGSVSAVVARSIFANYARGSLSFDGEYERGAAGGPCEPFMPVGRPRPMSDAITRIAVVPDVRVTPECGTLNAIERAAPYGMKLLGQKVFALRVSGSRPLGIVSRVGPIVVMQANGTLPEVEFDRSIEIRLRDGTEIARDEAGTLVLTEDGAALGLIVAAAPGAAYIASMAPLLADGQFRFLTREEANEHNSRALDLLQQAQTPFYENHSLFSGHKTFAERGPLLGNLGQPYEFCGTPA